jgi:hypothetical protein
MDRYEGPITALTISLHVDLCLSNIMYLYEGPHISLNIALLRVLCLTINDRYEGPHTSLNIALNRGLYIFIILDPYGRALLCRYYSLA